MEIIRKSGKRVKLSKGAKRAIEAALDDLPKEELWIFGGHDKTLPTPFLQALYDRAHELYREEFRHYWDCPECDITAPGASPCPEGRALAIQTRAARKALMVALWPHLKQLAVSSKRPN